MQKRLNVAAYVKENRAIKALIGIGVYLSHSKIETHLLDLVNFRVSQINGCAYCLDMHSKDLRVMGETEQRLYLLSAWREAPLYTERERAALAYAEAVTRIEQGVPDEVYAEAARHFPEEQLLDLTMAIVAINGFNRINVAFQTPAGHYQPGEHAVHEN